MFKTPAVSVNGVEPNISSGLVKEILGTLTVKAFILRFAGIATSSVTGKLTVAGAKKPVIKLYKPTLQVGVVAIVVNVPPSAVPLVAPIPKVGAAT